MRDNCRSYFADVAPNERGEFTGVTFMLRTTRGE